MNLGSDITRARRASKRTRSGCLPCRRRRKKCDEAKPTCRGCLRNHLICAWSTYGSANPTSLDEVTMTRPGSSSTPQTSDPTDPFIAFATITPTASISSLPPAFRGTEAASLLDSFRELTAPRMVGKGGIENPFITYNLRIAMQSTSVQHAILAVSACHRAYSEPAFSLPSLSHYAVALRSLKVGITKWHSCSIAERIDLLASCLTLCWYEVIDANIRGSLYHHLRASGSMIRDLQNDLRCRNKCLIGFFSEQYSYLAIVANIGTRQGSSDRLLDVGCLSQPLHTLNQETPIYGFMFGSLHGLFEMISRIASLSIKCTAPGISRDTQDEYDSIISEIYAWVLDNKTDGQEYELVGETYRSGCLMFLHTSMQGHEELSDQLEEEFETNINSFLHSFAQLSVESPLWTAFMWPTLIIGSYMKEDSQRRLLLQLLSSSRLQMQTVDSTAHWLSLHWAEMDQDSGLCGIGGMEKTMRNHGLVPCVG